HRGVDLHELPAQRRVDVERSREARDYALRDAARQVLRRGSAGRGAQLRCVPAPLQRVRPARAARELDPHRLRHGREPRRPEPVAVRQVAAAVAALAVAAPGCTKHTTAPPDGAAAVERAPAPALALGEVSLNYVAPAEVAKELPEGDVRTLLRERLLASEAF